MKILLSEDTFMKIFGGKNGAASRQLAFARTKDEASKVLLRSFARYNRVKLWSVGTRKWSLVVMKDEDCTDREPRV